MNKPAIFFYSITCAMMFCTNLFVGLIEKNLLAMFLVGVSFSGMIFIAYKIITETEENFKEKENE